MDKFEMDKNMKPGFVTGSQVKDLLAQFESEEDVKIFITNFVKTFEMVGHIYDKKQSDMHKMIGSLFQIINFFVYYQQILNRLAEMFTHTEMSQEELEKFKLNHKNQVIDFL